MGGFRGRRRPRNYHVTKSRRSRSFQCEDHRRGQGRPSHAKKRGVTSMKSTKVASDAGAETRVVILDSGEEAFGSLTKFANDTEINAASLTAIGAFDTATVGWFDFVKM